ncbi:MAG: holo-ACP synthase [Planctomycetota bacterium]|jgi:holo-[acyl-carrier protein] synthase
MILGTGVDLIEIDRIADLLSRHGDHFLQKTFTDAEQAYCAPKAQSAQHFAARFAAKEATMKALGTGWQKGVGFLSIEVFKEDVGKPRLRLHGRAQEVADSLGVTHMHLSLSHGQEVAIAHVILEGAT